NGLLESVGIKTEINDSFAGGMLLDAAADITEDMLYMNPSYFERYVLDETICGYITEHSQWYETGLEGELPDKDKDYGGKIPVIAAYSTGLKVGDELTAKYHDTLCTFLVTARYTDDNLEVFLGAGKCLYTDEEILYKNNFYERPENQPILDPNEDERYNGMFVAKAPEGMSKRDLDARLSYLKENLPEDETYMVVQDGPKDVSILNFNYRDVVMLTPIILLIVLIGILGAVANHIINFDKRRATLKVYAICGAKKRARFAYNVICEVFVIACSLGVALGLGFVFDYYVGGYLESITSSTISPFSIAVTSSVVGGVAVIMIISWLIGEKVHKEKLL
ncbi:MAG: hypothetical protein IKT78_02650, partial [Ruminiclostridium sp.]|nr:hypothetical protein [Ruminiclostridium sp.]